MVGERGKGCAEADVPASGAGSLHENWFGQCLRQVDVIARAGIMVIAMSVRVMAPRVNASVFLTCHAVAPPGVLHILRFRGIG